MLEGDGRLRRWFKARLFALALGGCQTGEAPQGGDASAAPCGRSMQATQAPAALRERQNPLSPTHENLRVGRELYEEASRPTPCAECHGMRGLGDGPIGRYLLPSPANFHCADVRNTPDGQLFWVIREGSNYLGAIETDTSLKRPGRRPAGTAMRPHRYFLSEEETWLLVLYLRHLGETP